jgi:hypothetical protein
VRSTDLRDGAGALKRHAARFRIFAYPDGTTPESWPRGDGVEVKIGDLIGGRTVANIIWTVHVANKKANTFYLDDRYGPVIDTYSHGELPVIRNADINKTEPPLEAPQPKDKIAFLNDPTRVRQLTIDPGPRVVSGRSATPVRFDKATTAAYFDSVKADIATLEKYPKSFPDDSFPHMDAPSGAIDTLGELTTDAQGRLLVLGGYGRAAGWRLNGQATPLVWDVNNNQWFDDTSDGPVSAAIVFTDGACTAAHGAWVATTDPSYAPQILNVVSLWDDVYDCWVREPTLALAPDIFDTAKGVYRDDYKPTFDDQIAPIFASASLQQWAVNLSVGGISGHSSLATITADTDPATTPLGGLFILRNPNAPNTGKEPNYNVGLMPAHLGDGGEPLLPLRKTQYFFLQRWSTGLGNFRSGTGAVLGPGEFLDAATFVNCLGGRFSPGIDLTFVMREPAIYELPWKSAGGGPFRIRAKPLAYATAKTPDKPLLTGGYVPRHVEADGLEPGDLTKFVAIPWHTDYNSCATHLPDPNPKDNRTLFWSWPAQRPVAVYLADEVARDSNAKWVRGNRRWSVRGPGTDSEKPENWGRYQTRLDILKNWNGIGVVIQAPQIEHKGDPLPTNWYLETASQLVDTNKTPVEPFPNIASDSS